MQNVFRKQTESTEYCGSVVTGPAKFAHRSNLDGTTDTICPRCVATVATVYDEGELLRYEQQHICDPVLVAQLYGKKPPSSEPVEGSQNWQFPELGGR